ncbi:MAG: hypothetical protein WC829_04805 [Hyphomicrobium sp.]|jgi:hypothetical protein
MTKLLALAAALAIALSGSISTAEAGMRMRVGMGALAIGALSAMAHRHHEPEYRTYKKPRAVRREREEKAPVRAAKKVKVEQNEVAENAPDKDIASEASSIATIGEESAPEVITGSTEAQPAGENSSIALTDERAPTQAKIVEAANQSTSSLDCKKFFPSVGMTLSVPCE